MNRAGKLPKCLFRPLTEAEQRAGVIELELVPVRGKSDRFDAIMPDGRVLVRSRQPLFDGARVLLAEGVPPETCIAVRHRGSTIVAMRRRLGDAAKWTIEESDKGGLRKRMWKPFDNARSSRDGGGENALGNMGVDDRPSASQEAA